MRSWTPTSQAQFGFLVTHSEAVSISDYYTVLEGERTAYRPTCHYAYHPCNDAVLSLHEMFGKASKVQETHHILDETEILDGIDELGVLLYGHAKNAYWFGSQLSIEETRRIAPYQNATGLQVTSAVLAGMVWALENPKAGIVEADEMDFRRCLEVQSPYLGPVVGVYTDWTPLAGRPGLFPEDIDETDSLAVPQRPRPLTEGHAMTGVVHVVGAGLSGLSAAVRLAEAGAYGDRPRGRWSCRWPLQVLSRSAARDDNRQWQPPCPVGQ